MAAVGRCLVGFKRSRARMLLEYAACGRDNDAGGYGFGAESSVLDFSRTRPSPPFVCKYGAKVCRHVRTEDTGLHVFFCRSVHMSSWARGRSQWSRLVFVDPMLARGHGLVLRLLLAGDMVMTGSGELACGLFPGNRPSDRALALVNAILNISGVSLPVWVL